VEGIARRLEEHLGFAKTFATWIEADPAWELCAPVPFATVCYRLRGDDAHNETVLERVNASGRAYISHTRLGGRFVLRASFGNPRQTEEHVRRLWNLLREAASAP
jgi:aromatic-L-amino-acid/L-tryptophan decarboxylase